MTVPRRSSRSFFARYGLAIAALFALLVPLMLLGTQRALQSNTNDVKSWLPAAYEETATFEWYWGHFENDAFILASWDGCTLDDPALQRVACALATSRGADGQGRSPFFSTVRTSRELLDLLVERQGVTEDEAVRRLTGSVIGPDGRQACLLLTISRAAMDRWDEARRQAGNAGPKFLHAAVEAVYQAAEDCGIARQRVHLGGPPVDNVSIDVEGERSLLRLAAFSAVVGLGMSWWCLRSWKLTLMVFTTALFAAGLSMAAVWLSGTAMNAILLTMPSLVYVAATSGAIHLANYYRDAARQHGVEGAAGAALGAAWLPLALATGTTAFGLVSLCISELVPIKLFGIFSAVGVVLSFVVLATWLPAVLELWPPHEILRPRTLDGEGAAGGLSEGWRRFGQAVVRRHGVVVATSLAVMALGAWGVSYVQTSVKLMRLFSPRAKIIQDYAWLEQRLGPLVPMEIVVRIDPGLSGLDLLDQMRLVARVQEAVAAMPEVGSALAAPTFARPLPPRAGAVERATWNVQLERHRADLADYWSTEGDEQLWRISARLGALGDLDYGEFVREIRRVVEPMVDEYRRSGVEGVSAVYTGLVPLIYKAQHSMLDGLIFGFVGDLILIGVAMILLTRDWSAGLLLMLPSVFPILLIFGVMGWLGIVVDTGTVMTPAVALGVTVDDAIHFMLWCRHGRQKGMAPPQAILYAYDDCARAIYQSWGVIGLGLFAFALSSFTPTRRFGVLMLAMLTASSIGNLVLLPALFAGPAGWRFWRRSWATRRRAEVAPSPDRPDSAEAGGEESGSVAPAPHGRGGAKAASVPTRAT